MLKLEFTEHADVRVGGGNRGSHWTWAIRNDTDHVIARSGGDGFATQLEAHVDARFAILSIKQDCVDEVRNEDAAKGARP